jgi:hypothetical protein
VLTNGAEAEAAGDALADMDSLIITSRIEKVPFVAEIEEVPWVLLMNELFCGIEACPPLFGPGPTNSSSVRKFSVHHNK